MTHPFPSREELRKAGKRQEAIDELYEVWLAAHAEAVKLAERIPAVFGDPPRPKITLHVARGYDDEWNLSEERIQELAALDPEQHWMEVSAESTQAEGWRFYLPAFLRHYLAEFPLPGWDAVYWACAERKHFDLITPEQAAFIDEFLNLCHAWE